MSKWGSGALQTRQSNWDQEKLPGENRSRLRKRLNGGAAGITKLPVTATPRQISRIAIAAVSIVTWFSISNHCVIGAQIAAHTQSATTQAPCHGAQSTPPNNGDEEMPCCKVLRATITAQAKTVQGPSIDFLPIQHCVPADPISADNRQIRCESCELDTGPPAVSFAESVLQRSILAHAPPCA